ncbi:asparagine--tRNA ligase, mitochondrial [Diutina catenulata]
MVLPQTIKQLLKQGPAAHARVCGHIKSVRHSKNVGFVDVTDGSSAKSLAIVFSNPEKVLSELSLQIGQSVEVTGEIVESKGKGQTVELKCDPLSSMKIVGTVPPTYPMQKKAITMQTLRSLPTLRHRTQTLASIMRLRSELDSRFGQFFAENDFCKVSPPIITSSDCEGAGETFRITGAKDFFGKDAYLTVSTQLHLEVLSQSLSRVWTLTPCFRAEESNTNRHLSEFWMLEAEISNISRVGELTAFTEAMIKNVTKDFIDDLTLARFDRKQREDITKRWTLMQGPWNTITYTEAIDIVAKWMPGERHVKWGDSLSTPHEKWLAGSHFGTPVFITDYPQDQKPFYMPLSPGCDVERPTVACYDLIVPEIGELVGGSIREHELQALKEQINAKGMDCEQLSWYLSLRENGTVPHGGFGMGFDRLVCYLGAMENLKDVIPFPRVPEHCDC